MSRPAGSSAPLRPGPRAHPAGADKKNKSLQPPTALEVSLVHTRHQAHPRPKGGAAARDGQHKVGQSGNSANADGSALTVRHCKKKKKVPSSMLGVDVHLSGNVERLQRQKVGASTSLLTPDICCVLFVFFLEIKSHRQTSHVQEGVKQMAIRQKNAIS